MYDPLACAAGNKHDDAILLLLEHGAGSSINGHDLGTIHWRTTHLLLYIEAGGSNEMVIDMLTQCGSDMFRYGTATTQYDRRVRCITPLGLAIHTGNMQAISAMLKYRTIQGNPYDNEGASECLHDALSKGYIDICKQLLIRPEIDINRKYVYGDTILHTLIRKKNKELATFILTHPSITVDAGVYNEMKQTLIHKAIVYKMYDILKLLLDYDPSITKKVLIRTKIQAAMEPCLHLAARKDDVKALEMMYPYVTDINLRTHKSNQTPLDVAKALGKTNAVKWLIDHGAKIE